jgi:hypothetical protein
MNEACIGGRAVHGDEVDSGAMPRPRPSVLIGVWGALGGQVPRPFRVETGGGPTRVAKSVSQAIRTGAARHDPLRSV